MQVAAEAIVAIATPPGVGGIAVVRISGNDAFSVASRVFVPKNETKQLRNAKGYRALYGAFYANEEEIDEGIALCFRAPNSYTGEDVVELQCHGGEQICRHILQACIAAGAAQAEAGEFTKRAFVNGKLSLTQAEAVMEMVNASSLQAAKAAKKALSGNLWGEIEDQKGKLVELMGHLVAWTDYPEEDVEALEPQRFLGVIRHVRRALNGLLEGYHSGVIMRRGARAAIVGSPNVGKSTLFNLLAGEDRAIVTSVAGTTRDVLREHISVKGIPLSLSDTAGLRETRDEVEKHGIDRSYGEIEAVDIVLAVFDATDISEQEVKEMACLCEGSPSLAIINKRDLQRVAYEQYERLFSKVVHISALDKESRAQMEEAIAELLRLHEVDPNMAMLANERQYAACKRAQDALLALEQDLEGGITFDAAGILLEDAIAALMELNGENATDAIIDEVFEKFCVGK